MADAIFSIVEGFQSEDETARREALGRIIDGYLQERLSSERGSAHP